jgi:Abnormal spindle-like microcephaly-assoc'd, ASPM-SPD-2-Hydin/Beta-propeller repeat
MKHNGTFAVGLFTSLLLTLVPCLAQQTASKATTAPSGNYGKLPLLFEKNQGQTDPRVKFFSAGAGYSVFLTSGEMVLSLRPSDVVNPSAFMPSASAAPTHNAQSTGRRQPVAPTVTNKAPRTTMVFKLVGAKANPEVVGENLMPTKLNYFIGNDRTKWRKNVATYGQVRYKNVYPGIDLVYYGNQHQMEYDFDVAPGADASKIQFDIQGADNLSINTNGDLVLKKGAGELHFQAPIVYQQSQGKRTQVGGSYAVSGTNRVAFNVAAHDNTKPLVIDPVLAYSTFLGGSSYDQASGIAIDSTGNAFVTGATQSPDFPLATLGSLTAGQNLLFLAKLDVSGTTLLWADYICGTSGNDNAQAVATDSQGNAYITGNANSSDFPTVNPFQAALSGGGDAFLTKVSPDGSTLVYSTYLGGSNWDYATGVAVDSTGAASIAGYTSSLNFPVANAFQPTAPTTQYNYEFSFVSKFSADGSSLVFSTYLAGSQTNCYYGCNPYSEINGIALDPNGNVYVAGQTDTLDFPVSEGAYQATNPTTNNNYDANTSFVSSFTPSGGLNYSTYYGGSNYAYIYGIAVDANGSAYVTGNAPADGSFPVTNTTICDPSSANCSSAFVTKLTPDGTGVVYSTFLGPNNNTQGQKIKLDTNGDIFVLAYSGNGSYILTNPIETFNNNGGVMIDEIDPNGATELFSTFLGGNNGAQPTDFAVDSNSSVYVTGVTNSNDFPVLQSAFQSQNGGQADVFISKIAQDNASAFSVYPSLLQYSTRTVGSTSAPRTAILRNMGTAALNINTKTLTGDFAETDDCGSVVPAAGSCTFTITFTPTAPGSRFGTILFGDDAAGSPHFINLVGDGSSPIVVLNPTSLTFASASVNSTSAAQTVTLSNTGNATLNIGNIQMSGDFAQTNNCPSSLGFGSSCQFQITFTPTEGGSRTGSMTLTDDAPDSPESVTLSGSGFVTTGTVSPGTLSFGNQNLNVASAAQVVTVTNTGGNVMTVSGVSTTGDFSQTNNCSSLAADGGTCAISVIFTPTTSGSRSGTLVINDNAQGNPHSVSLGGMGIAGTASLSAASLSFTPLNVGATSAAQTLTITNTGNGPLTISSIQVNGDFAQTNNCTTVAATSSCAVQVTFTPSSSGSRTGNLTITSSAIGSPQSVSLTGSGIDFSMPSSGGSSTVKAGATATYQLGISPVGGTFSNAISLACEGVPALASCTINPTSVTPGASTSSVTVTVTTKASAAVLDMPARGAVPQRTFAGLWMVNGLGIFGVLIFGNLSGNKNRKSRKSWFILLGFALTMMIVLAGCGGASTSTSTTPPPVAGTPAGTYTVIVVGTSGSAQHFSSLTLIVQ